MATEQWFKAPTAEDVLMVELLLYLRHSSLPPPSWTVRQPRSRPLSLKNGVPRPSPSTPLSWSGGATSHSGAAGGGAAPVVVQCSGESSRRVPGSKVTGTNKATGSKNSRKKKTKPELQEEVNLMLKEKNDLKKTLANLLRNLEKQKATNLNLKRRKMDIGTQLTTEGGAMLPPKVTGVGSDAILHRHLQVQKEANVREGKFAVPDLNVIFEESSAEGLNEMDQYDRE